MASMVLRRAGTRAPRPSRGVLAPPSASPARCSCRGSGATTRHPGWRAGGRLGVPGAVHGGDFVSDESVPEGHKGLHGALYGEGDAHKASEYTKVKGEDDGAKQFEIGDWLASRKGQKPCGLYAIYDRAGELQYVGYSRNIVWSVGTQLERHGGEACAFVRAKVAPDRVLATRSYLEGERELWLSDLGASELPPGNLAMDSLWEDAAARSAGAKAVPSTEVEGYEEGKLKMRRAMGENLYDDEEMSESEQARQRRLKTMKAVEGDDWSEVIEGQTLETQEQGAAGAVASPFAKPGAAAVGAARKEVELTVDSANGVLEEVRPYLIADGGNVLVVDVVDGVVKLRLEGACGTCASSTATMSMGIERALQSAFGARLKGVERVDEHAGASQGPTTAAQIDLHLGALRPAIESYGGAVEVLEVTPKGACHLYYKGPPPLAAGISAAVRDKFPDIKEVHVFESKAPK